MLSLVTSTGATPEQSDALKHNEIIAYPIVLEVPCIDLSQLQVEFIFKKGSLDKWLENPPDSIKMYPDHPDPDTVEMFVKQDRSEFIGKWTEFEIVEFEFKGRDLQALQAKGTFNTRGYKLLSSVKGGSVTGVSCGFGVNGFGVEGKEFVVDENSTKLINEVVAIHEISVMPHSKNPLARVKKVSSIQV